MCENQMIQTGTNNISGGTEELRRIFWEEDATKGGYIRQQSDEIKEALIQSNIDFAERQLRVIKEHTIQNCSYYKDYTVDSEFPIVNKLIIRENIDGMLAKGDFQLPLHKSYTSGSTGIPFTVIQDYKSA